MFMLTTKDHVIASLIKADGYISGEKISSSLGISRAAINAAAFASAIFQISIFFRKAGRTMETRVSAWRMWKRKTGRSA